VKIALVIPYYEDADLLARQYDAWAAWPDDVRDAFQCVVVDDGSRKRKAAKVKRPVGLPRTSIYRVLKDIRWNQHGARNLGAYAAEAPWLLLTDCDHGVDADCARRLVDVVVSGSVNRSVAYMLDRVDADTGKATVGRDGRPKPHPNTFFLTRDLFWQVGGYDESYRGVYGTDALFRRRLPKVGHLQGAVLRRWSEEMGVERHTLPRKEGRDPRAREKVLRRKRDTGRENHVTVLDFQWERVL
jgi:glycosyltransferase involved in cell wall biosynthesis